MNVYLFILLTKRKKTKLYENYRGISLLSIAGKILTHIVNGRLRTMAEKILPESQSGFRYSPGTTDIILYVRQLQEKCREQYQLFFLAFIGPTKPFDSIHRSLLWCILTEAGCPPKLLNIIRLLDDGMSARVIIGSTLSEPFNATFGVKQKCVIAPTLFVIFITSIMHLIKDKIPQHNDISSILRKDCVNCSIFTD